MSTISTSLRRSLIAAILITAGSVAGTHATVTSYSTALDGASESPPNPSPGIGSAQVDIDDVAHTLHLQFTFEGLSGPTTAAHIHAATSAPGEGNVGVATGIFAGFPVGVTSGSYDIVFDLTLATSYSASFLAAHGDAAGAEAALTASIAAGTAYLNIHTTMYPGGEIRGFFGEASVPVTETTWGELKSLFD